MDDFSHLLVFLNGGLIIIFYCCWSCLFRRKFPCRGWIYLSLFSDFISKYLMVLVHSSLQCFVTFASSCPLLHCYLNIFLPLMPSFTCCPYIHTWVGAPPFGANYLLQSLSSPTFRTLVSPLFLPCCHSLVGLIVVSGLAPPTCIIRLLEISLWTSFIDVVIHGFCLLLSYLILFMRGFGEIIKPCCHHFYLTSLFFLSIFTVWTACIFVYFLIGAQRNPLKTHSI